MSTAENTGDPGRLREKHPLSSWLARAPRCLRLAELPTPVERAPWLDDARGEVWIKRDDLSSPLYGGGKVRKLEWSLANPPFDDMGPVTSVGGAGSNHLVALALFLRRLDRRLHAIVFEQPFSEHARTNLAVMASLDSTFWYVRRRWQLPLAFLAFHLRRAPELGTFMDPGGSTPLGCFGFVAAGLELAEQIREGALPRPDDVFVTGGTGGAAAGLVIGLALAQVPTHVHAVSAVEPLLFNRMLMTAKLRAVLEQLRACGLSATGKLGELLQDAGVTWSIDHGHVGRCYAAPTSEGIAVQRLAAEHGVHLDTTYTAKCMAALQASRTRGPSLFWHTHASQDLRGHIVPRWRDRLPPRLRRALQRWEIRAELAPEERGR